MARATFGDVATSLFGGSGNIWSWQGQHLALLERHFSWQGQHLVMLQGHFSWQGQHLVMLKALSWQGHFEMLQRHMAAATFGDVGASLFMARATCRDVAMSLLVAGPRFGDVAMSLFVAWGKIWRALFVAGASFGGTSLVTSLRGSGNIWG